ncbi:alpha-hydroxy-acid oxidizing protein [Methylobacterium mesophilicum SR1.6/6]|uniref:Alpha-hydroxy-acid oxidizing protein n=1 Tax=Methylobacterium mesophilicum SR1.6/6 TaxID=908290 RepID=A0A6B9FRR1_9HYPH|nr:alpha-hydroxy acid oxidase [Methylobacterium mesophilicum]QGY05363.1 alpha-hydroxy-acid oxidizing protein [Methylobacterium mesophilicum SR1.6/6]
MTSGAKPLTGPIEAVPGTAATGIPASAGRRRRPFALALADYEAAARRRLPRPVFGYIAGAAETNAALDDNRQALREYGFVPRVLVGVGARKTATPMFGRDYAAPFGIAPMGLSALAAYRGDIALAAAARAARVPMIMSASSLIRMEDVIPHNPEAWFQAYLPGEPDRIVALIDRIAAAGFGTLVVTVDTVISGNRENITRTGFSTPLRPSLRLALDGLARPRWTAGTFLRTLARHGMPHFENSHAARGAPILSASVLRDFGNRDHLCWDHLRLVRDRWRGRLVVKGIMAAADARTARDLGADGVILSNHGGRQLDATVSPLRTLPAVVQALGGTIPVMIDSGFRRGTDVLKAMALGAAFVFVGRPFLYAASLGGRAEVERAITILKDEVGRNMGLLGVNALSELGPDRLHRIPSGPNS